MNLTKIYYIPGSKSKHLVLPQGQKYPHPLPLPISRFTPGKTSYRPFPTGVNYREL